MLVELTKVALTMTVTLPQHIFERHLASSPHVVGRELADQVIQFVQSHHLGYFPALDYIQRQHGIEKELIDAASHISWFVSKLAREEIQRKLRSVFSSLIIDSVQVTAFTLPSVRPTQLNSRYALTRHYTPDTVKVAITASSFQKNPEPEVLAKWAKHTVYRWLKGSFECLEVTSVQAVHAPDDT